MSSKAGLFGFLSVLRMQSQKRRLKIQNGLKQSTKIKELGNKRLIGFGQYVPIEKSANERNRGDLY